MNLSLLLSTALITASAGAMQSSSSLRRRLQPPGSAPPPPNQPGGGGPPGQGDLDTVPTVSVEGQYSLINSFSVPKSPSGMFYDDDTDVLYILCGTQTNGEHTLYAYTTGGTSLCTITIPQSVGMSRVDGFYIHDGSAYIVDSQGPLYADQGKLGGSVYQTVWSNPCDCVDAACSQTSVDWIPDILDTLVLSSEAVGDGGEFFRNSGIVVMDDDTYFAVNGVHPAVDSPYPKSVVRVDLNTNEILTQWPFTATEGVGRDVDMEGLTCGADGCSEFLYIGDEYQYVYKLALNDTDIDTAVQTYWNVRSVAGDVSMDKGIEALAYANGYFYAGIQETAMVYVLDLTE